MEQAKKLSQMLYRAKVAWLFGLRYGHTAGFLVFFRYIANLAYL